MKWYHGLSLGRKILAGFLLVAGVSGLSGILAAGSIYDVAARAERMYTGNFMPISGLPEVVREYQTSLCLLRDIVIDRSEQERLEHRELLQQSSGKVEKGLAAFFASNRSPQAAALQKSITEDLKLFGFFRDKIVDLAASGRQDEAVNIMRNQGGDVITRIDSGIAEVVSLNKAQAGKRHAENTKAARFALALSAACLSLGVAAALAIGYFLSRSITAPLSTVAGKVAAIAAGDLTVRLSGVAATTGSRNQLHVLSHHVDQMAQTLHSVVSCMVSESGKLSTASGALNDRSTGMVAGADSACQQIEMVALSSAEIDGAASEIARNCSVAADNVSRANRAIESACRIMGETIGTMQVVGEQSRETSVVLSRLGDRSLQIGEITNTIEDISDQTNLLALNAAIEAARAGEQGRGFAVVADEVRVLALRTSTATGEIAQMIRSIQAETRLAINAMERGVAEAEQGVAKALCTGEALAALTAIIEAIAMEVSHIATAAEEQSLSVHSMTGNIGQVTAVIRESSDGAQEFAAAAARMHLVADELKTLVCRFTLA